MLLPPSSSTLSDNASTERGVVLSPCLKCEWKRRMLCILESSRERNTTKKPVCSLNQSCCAYTIPNLVLSYFKDSRVFPASRGLVSLYSACGRKEVSFLPHAEYKERRPLLAGNLEYKTTTDQPDKLDSIGEYQRTRQFHNKRMSFKFCFGLKYSLTLSITFLSQCSYQHPSLKEIKTVTQLYKAAFNWSKQTFGGLLVTSSRRLSSFRRLQL